MAMVTVDGDSNSSTNVSLLVRVRDPQNHDAWAKFDAKYRPMIVHYCRSKLGMLVGDADEAAQIVLVKLLENMREFQYDPNQSFRAWLSRVTRNSVIDGMRRRKPDRAVGGTDVIKRLNNLSAEDDLIDQLSLELRQTLFAECRALVQSRVTEQTWQAFEQLRTGRKAADVAGELGMTLAAVYRSKTRVLKLFRQEVTMRLRADGEASA